YYIHATTTTETYTLSLHDALPIWIHTELAAKIGKLQDLILNYDPVLLMHRAAYILLPLFMKYSSENEYSNEESLALPGVEYLQRSEEHTSELQSRFDLVCRLLLEK